MRLVHTLMIFIIAISFVSCSSLVLKPADFAWPVESVLEVDSEGNIADKRYSFRVNVKELLKNEHGINKADKEIKLRVIRDYLGYYFVTGENFRFIYIFEDSEGALTLSNKINIPGIDVFSNPALNQRSPFIEFLNGEEKYILNNEGVVE